MVDAAKLIEVALSTEGRWRCSGADKDATFNNRQADIINWKEYAFILVFVRLLVAML